MFCFFHSTTTFIETDDTFVGILHRIIEQVMYDNPASFERIIRWHREILSHSVHQIPFLCDMMTLRDLAIDTERIRVVSYKNDW